METGAMKPRVTPFVGHAEVPSLVTPQKCLVAHHLVGKNHAHQYFTNKRITVEIADSAPPSSAANLSIPKC